MRYGRILMAVAALALMVIPLPGFASSAPKTVASNIPTVEATAADHGFVYFVVYPTTTEADVYRLDPGDGSALKVYSHADPSANFPSCLNGVISNGVTISELHFDPQGDVYFLLTVGISTGATTAQLTESIVELDAGSHAGTTIAQAVSTIDQQSCYVGADAVTAGGAFVAIAVDQHGTAYALEVVHDQNSGVDDTYVMSYSAGGSPAHTVARVADGFADWNLNVNNQGDLFFFTYPDIGTSATTSNVYEVTPTGGVALLIQTSNGFLFSAMRQNGDLYLLAAEAGGVSVESLKAPIAAGEAAVTLGSLATVAGTVVFQLGDSDLFAVSNSGSVYFTDYSITQAPFALDSSNVYGLAPGSSSIELLASDPSSAFYPPYGVAYNAISLATIGGTMYYSSWAAGTISSIAQ